MLLSSPSVLVRKLDILIIEDSPTVRRSLKRSLEKAIPDCSVHEAEDGFQAFQALGRLSAGLIISDLQMPRMDGWTFLKTLRANAILKKKPVIILSAEPVAAMAEAMRQDPMLRFLTKPAMAEAMRQDPMLRFLTKPASAEQIAQAAGELLGSPR